MREEGGEIGFGKQRKGAVNGKERGFVGMKKGRNAQGSRNQFQERERERGKERARREGGWGEEREE